MDGLLLAYSASALPNCFRVRLLNILLLLVSVHGGMSVSRRFGQSTLAKLVVARFFVRSWILRCFACPRFQGARSGMSLLTA